MRAGVAIAVLATGCTRILGVHDFPPEVVDNKTCYGTMFPVCFDVALPDPRTLSGAIDTDDVLCRGTLSDGTSACIIAATDLTVLNVRAHGSLPLLLIAQDQLTISGTLDVGSHGGVTGPNADGLACIPATPGWGEDQQAGLRASAGGAGGSFGALGGDGGGVQDNQSTAVGGGRANSAIAKTALRGGCPGSAGGVPGPGTIMVGQMLAPSVPGAGGGAVVLVADAIQIDGAVDASGGGGGGGGMTVQRQYGGGGAGGGSGGLVVLDASIAMVSGLVIANGGGGGSGGGRNSLGKAGADGGPPLDSAAPGGTSGDPETGAGGNGGGRAMTAGDGITLQFSSDSGAGGGGGGTGLVLSRVAIANASPAAMSP